MFCRSQIVVTNDNTQFQVAALPSAQHYSWLTAAGHKGLCNTAAAVHIFQIFWKYTFYRHIMCHCIAIMPRVHTINCYWLSNSSDARGRLVSGYAQIMPGLRDIVTRVTLHIQGVPYSRYRVFHAVDTGWPLSSDVCRVRWSLLAR